MTPLLLLVLGLVQGLQGLNVLLSSTVSSPSHHIWVTSLAGSLLERGHHVTELVMRQPASHPNRTSFVITGKTFAEEHGFDLEETFDYSVLEEIQFLYTFCRESANIALNSTALKDLVRHLNEKKPKYDVFVIDYIMQEPLLGLNTLIGRAPVVAVTAYNMPEDALAVMGSPYFPSLLPYDGVGADGGEAMTFSQRAYNVYKWLVSKAYIHWSYRPWVDMTIAQSFPGAPSLAELQSDVAVILVNTIPALHGAMPLVPTIVEVGGMQARTPKPLPKDIFDWVDNADPEHGFVLMSFGTNVKSSMIAKYKRDAILRAFSRIPQRVIWKYEEDDIMDKLPPNVRIFKWLPQNDILAHPKIRCFVSHNGGLSSQEASFHGVPVLGVPFFADQVGYAEKFLKLGLGRRVIYRTLTEEIFSEALNDVLTNPKYMENMQRVKLALRDQKETPLERATWWVEHVARTKGARHLRTPALQLAWYQLWMLDLVAAAAAVAGLCLWVAARARRAVAALRASRSPGTKRKVQ